MIRGFYAGASGLISQQHNMNTIANNLANVSTAGYKPQQTAFASLIYANINGGGGRTIQSGHGVRVSAAGLEFSQGGLKQTDMPLDCAILGEGLFALQSPEGKKTTYTRDGSFRASAEGEETYLVSADGAYVLDEKGQKISLKKGLDPSKIAVYSFPNKYGLELLGGNRFGETAASGKAERVKEPQIRTGYLENSKVEVSAEMVRMIEANKAFSLGAKVVQTADEMEKIINQLR